MLKLVHDATAKVVDDPEAMTISFDELCRMAAQEMLAAALLAERRAYLEAHATELDAAGHRPVVGNGYARAREVTTGAGMVEVQAPRVDDRRHGERFSSAILPAYMRKSPKVPSRRVRLRTKVTRGAGSRKAGLAMAYKLLGAAQARWRRINGHELVPLVRAGATFIDGKLQERSDENTDTQENTGSLAALSTNLIHNY
jgi:hypothetical protein